MNIIIFESEKEQKKIIQAKIKHVAAGHLSGLFGYRIHPIRKTLQFHNGLDIALPIGTPLHSPLAGCRITKIWEDKLNGKAIRISMPLYYEVDNIQHNCPILGISVAHLEDWDGYEGGILGQGEVFAHTGNTGASTGPHAHICFWQRVDDKRTAVDPLPWLANAVGIKEVPVRSQE